MARVDRSSGELHFAIAFAGMGADATVEHIVNAVAGSHMERHPGGVYARMTPGSLGRLDGMRMTFHLYSYDGPRPGPAVDMTRLDAIVPIIDGTHARLTWAVANRLLLDDLEERAAADGRAWSSLVRLYQANLDGDDPVDVDELKEALGEEGTWVETTPSDGEGVLTLLKSFVTALITAFRAGTLVTVVESS